MNVPSRDHGSFYILLPKQHRGPEAKTQNHLQAGLQNV